MKKYFHGNPLCFRIYADFEADNQIPNSRICIETAKNYKQNQVCNRYYKISELNDIFKSDDNTFNLDYENVYWFVDEVVNLENNL